MMLTKVSLHFEQWCNGIIGPQKNKLFSWAKKLYFIYPVNYLISTPFVLIYSLDMKNLVLHKQMAMFLKLLINTS